MRVDDAEAGQLREIARSVALRELRDADAADLVATDAVIALLCSSREIVDPRAFIAASARNLARNTIRSRVRDRSKVSRASAAAAPSAGRIVAGARVAIQGPTEPVEQARALPLPPAADLEYTFSHAFIRSKKVMLFSFTVEGPEQHVERFRHTMNAAIAYSKRARRAGRNTLPILAEWIAAKLSLLVKVQVHPATGELRDRDDVQRREPMDEWNAAAVARAYGYQGGTRAVQALTSRFARFVRTGVRLDAPCVRFSKKRPHVTT